MWGAYFLIANVVVVINKCFYILESAYYPSFTAFLPGQASVILTFPFLVMLTLESEKVLISRGDC